ncbi:MAG: hypothetical protein FWD32_00510, partial [Firmicutes bacterium]|nr:hypothetical protein [Bacillota bacterium]
ITIIINIYVYKLFSYIAFNRVFTVVKKFLKEDNVEEAINYINKVLDINVNNQKVNELLNNTQVIARFYHDKDNTRAYYYETYTLAEALKKINKNQVSADNIRLAFLDETITITIKRKMVGLFGKINSQDEVGKYYIMSENNCARFNNGDSIQIKTNNRVNYFEVKPDTSVFNGHYQICVEANQDAFIEVMLGKNFEITESSGCFFDPDFYMVPKKNLMFNITDYDANGNRRKQDEKSEDEDDDMSEIDDMDDEDEEDDESPKKSKTKKQQAFLDWKNSLTDEDTIKEEIKKVIMEMHKRYPYSWEKGYKMLEKLFLKGSRAQALEWFSWAKKNGYKKAIGDMKQAFMLADCDVTIDIKLLKKDSKQEDPEDFKAIFGRQMAGIHKRYLKWFGKEWKGL